MADWVVIMLIVIASVETLAIILLAVLFAMQKGSVSKLAANAAEVAGKNMEVEDIKVSGGGSLGELAKNINLIKLNLRAFVESTKGNVITLTDAIGVLQGATKETQNGVGQTSESLNTVADKVSEQLALVKDNLDIIESNNGQLEEIDQAMAQIQDTLGETVGSCNEGIANLERYEAGMTQIQNNLNQCVKILDEFSAQINQVNSIGELVIDISEELQLLALNASIEAARAGEAGKGFAVVSQEMGVLSEKTKLNMDEITGILGKVTESSELVNKSIMECNDAFNASAAVFNDVSGSLRTISSQSGEIDSKMRDITDKYSRIANNSDLSKGKAEDLYSASEVISDSTRDIVAVSEQTSAEATQIADNVESLENMLSGIRNLIGQFKTGIMPTKKNRTKKVRIAFFSKLDNYFWFAIRRGVSYAEKELSDNNVEILYFPYKDDIEEKQFPDDVEKCVNEGVDAIIYPGFLTLADKQIAAGASRGVKILTYNCDCGKSIKRLSCYEPDQEEAGVMAADAAAKALGRSGNVAVILGDRTAAVNKIRYESFLNRLKSNYKDIQVVNTTEVSYNPEKTYQQELDLLKKHPEIDLVYSTTGMQIQLAKAIEDAGRRGKVKAVVFDQNDEIFNYIKKGVIAAAIDHDPFSQGHDPIIYMYNHLVDGMVLPNDRIKCKASVVDSDNIADRISAG